jgi:hypothetical protein
MPILKIEDLKALIVRILESGYVQPSAHCRDVRMPQRNVSMQDIRFCLANGDIHTGTEEDDISEGVYRIIGSDIDGEPLTVVFKIIEDLELIFCITVF